MPGNLSRIFSIINSVLPSEAAAFIRNVGTAFPLDVFMTGETRFGRKIGELLPVMLADNNSFILVQVPLMSSTIEIFGQIPWMVFGSKLLLRESELVTVDDYSFDSVLNVTTVKLKEKTKASYPVNSKVLLFGNPLTVLEAPRCAVSPGSLDPGPPVDGAVVCYKPQSILVTSTHKIYDPDEIAINYSTYQLQKAILVGSTPGLYTYRLILTDAFTFPPPSTPFFPRAGDTIYLRCNPAYESKILPIPNIPPSEVGVGPFCLDWFSGYTVEETQYDEQAIATLYDSANNVLYQNKVEKNDLILLERINSDAMLFWDKLRGKMNWNGTETLLSTDTGAGADAPAFMVHYRCVPVFQPGQVGQWRLRVTNDNTIPCLITITLDPNPPQSFLVDPLTTSYLPVIFGNQPIQRIYVAGTGTAADFTPGAFLPKPIKFGNWLTDKVTATAASFIIVVKADSRFKYGTTSLFMKPIFLSTEYLKAILDFDAMTDAGKMALT